MNLCGNIPLKRKWKRASLVTSQEPTPSDRLISLSALPRETSLALPRLTFPKAACTPTLPTGDHPPPIAAPGSSQRNMSPVRLSSITPSEAEPSPRSELEPSGGGRNSSRAPPRPPPLSTGTCAEPTWARYASSCTAQPQPKTHFFASTQRCSSLSSGATAGTHGRSCSSPSMKMKSRPSKAAMQYLEAVMSASAGGTGGGGRNSRSSVCCRTMNSTFSCARSDFLKEPFTWRTKVSAGVREPPGLVAVTIRMRMCDGAAQLVNPTLR
mmetsp:Transcript_10057/g.24029  ORF Transcript_10057/g.24029 Transcript_10057/m.24029 type:complete len:268 (+) Transcript_10057:510-1313(+)